MTTSKNQKTCIRFDISDTGCGIRDEDLPKLFKEFTKLDDTKSQSKMSTGLGLYLSNNLSKKLGDGSNIQVKSEY